MITRNLDTNMLEDIACSFGAMVNASFPVFWDQSINGHSLGYCNVNAPN